MTIRHQENTRGDILSSSSVNGEGEESTESVLAWASRYIELGLNPTPNFRGTKAARLPEWQNTRIDESNVEILFKPTDHIGLLLGEMSGGLVVADLDSVGAVALADLLLPPTGLIEGRPSKPDSHWFYRCDPLPAKRSFRSPATGEIIVELLVPSEPGKGAQVVVPPSLVPAGENGGVEQRAWTRFDPKQLPALPGEDLLAAVTRLAVWYELAAIWPAAGRHDAARAMAGGLMRAGWPEAETVALLQHLYTMEGDSDLIDRCERGEPERIVSNAAAQLAAAEPHPGWPKLKNEILPEAKVSIDTVCDWLGVSGADRDDDRPVVWITGKLDSMSDLAWKALEATNDPPALFRRSNQPVRVERIDDTDTVITRQLDVTLLRHHVAERVRWVKPGKDGPVSTMPPVDVVKNMLAFEDIPLPILNRVVTVPVFAPDGTLQTEPGYHPEGRVYYKPPANLTLPTIPQQPKRGEVERARDLLLNDLLGDFPFQTDADRAHAVALALLPFVRDMIDGPTPLHLFEAPKAGTGKGLLVRALTMIAVGGTGAHETPLPTVEEELRKKILSLLLEGHPFIYFDNINQRVDSASLAGALTSMVFQDRKLGVSETAFIPVQCGWIATGNNPVMTTEIARRTVRSRLVAEVEQPHRRTGFRHPHLVNHVTAHRGEYVAAVLTLAQAWVAAGKPAGSATLGSYETWAEVIGGILDAAGIPGFLENVEDFYESADDEGAAWRSFVNAWWTASGPEAQSATQLRRIAVEAGIPFNQWEMEKQASELGTLLRKQVDSMYAGFAIRQGKDRKTKANKYRLEPKDGQTWTPQPPSRVLTVNGDVPPFRRQPSDGGHEREREAS